MPAMPPQNVPELSAFVSLDIALSVAVSLAGLSTVALSPPAGPESTEDESVDEESVDEESAEIAESLAASVVSVGTSLLPLQARARAEPRARGKRRSKRMHGRIRQVCAPRNTRLTTQWTKHHVSST